MIYLMQKNQKKKERKKTVHLMTFIQSERVHFTFDGFLTGFACIRIASANITTSTNTNEKKEEKKNYEKKTYPLRM